MSIKPFHEFLEFSRTGGRNGEAGEVLRFFVKTKLVLSRIFGGGPLP